VEVSAWDAAAVLAKAIAYAATLGAAGAIFFLIYGHTLLHDAQRRGIYRCFLILAASAAATSLLRVSLLAASMSDSLEGMLDISFAGMILRAGEGAAVLERLVGLLLGAALFKSGRVRTCMGFAGAVLAAVSFAAVGHVHALEPDRIPVLILMLHLCCGAFWLGALWPLLRVARDADDSRTAALARRFGKVALYVVGSLLAAGVLLSYRLLGSLAALWSSDYGRVLGIKLLLVAMLLLAAAVNKLRLTPRLSAGDAAAATHLRRSIRFEMLLGALILLATAAFTSLTGPES
jgi:putative copper resistance protein D